MGILDGGLQGMMGAAFAVHLLDGRHYRESETRDAKGNVTATVIQTQSFKGFRENSTKAMREAGYAPETVVILMLQTYEGVTIAKPNRDEKVLLDGQRWVLGDLIDEDAARVAWRFAATPE